jgi:hypothetical protein
MTLRVRLDPIENLLGLRIDHERDDGTEAPSVIVVFRESCERPVGTTDAGIANDPLEFVLTGAIEFS